MSSAVEQVALLASSVLLAVLYRCAQFLRILFKINSLRQFEGRGPGDELSAWRLPPLPAGTSQEMLFFCSSAGEYEQALPLVQKLSDDGKISALFLFLSRSGLDFFRARREPGRAALAPVDTTWNWHRFAHHHPVRASVVIRHEWWPAFLHVMGSTGPLFLVDAGMPAGNPGSRWKNAGRGYLAKKFSAVFTVDDASREFFIHQYGLPQERVITTGDTKFDRVLDRTSSVPPRKLRDDILALAAGRSILVCGSVYDEDVQLIFEAFAAEPGLRHNWFVVLVPHHVGRGATARFAAIANQHRLSGALGKASTGQPADFTTVDVMGSLAELYALSSAAWVGGACHNKVHNVLEPAAWSAWLACGPRLHNSREAVLMHDAGILRAIDRAGDLGKWLAGVTAASPGGDGKDPRTKAFIESHAGASQRIARFIGQTLFEGAAKLETPR